MKSVLREVANSPDSSFQGHSSGDVADRLAAYAKNHQSDGGILAAIQQSLNSPSNATKSSMLLATSSPGAGAASSGIMAATSNDPAFSISALLSYAYGFKVVYCILWIVLGVFLMFFGLASFYWATAPRFAPKHGKTSRRIFAGGVGGMAVGFLSGSYLAIIITNAVATRHHTSLSAGGVFALFLAPALLLLAVAAHLRIVSRMLAGLLGGVCLTNILTALFGVKTISARSIMLAIFCIVLTVPQVIPPKTRYHRTKQALLNLSTSLIGTVAFLDGVALFAPPQASSRAWIDLWTLLFAPDDSPSQKLTVAAWGTGAFKGFIAGALLSVLISVAFEAWFHRGAGDSVEDEWNEYLGVYTGRLEKGEIYEDGTDALPGSFASRAGLFEPPRSIWSRVKDAVEQANSSPRRTRGPASYGNIAGRSSAPEAGGLTERTPPIRRLSGRSRVSSYQVPARFEALSKGEAASRYDKDEDVDSDVTEFDRDGDDVIKEKKESRDVVTELPKMVNYGGYSLPAPLPRPPSYRTDSGVSTSQLSGSTAVSSAAPSREGSNSGATSPPATGAHAAIASASSRDGQGDVHRPHSVYRDAVAPSSSSPSKKPALGGRSVSTPATEGPAFLSATGRTASASASSADGPNKAGVVAATPSLINAIDRIKRAQAQAREWQAQQTQPAPYGQTAEADK